MPTHNNQPGEFIVKESATTNILIGLFFLVLSILIVYNLLNHQNTSYNDHATEKLKYILIATCIPSAGFIIKGLLSPVVITVNKNGFYYYGTLKTNWDHLMGIEMVEEPVTGSYQDKFILLLRFYDEERGGYFLSKIPMRNTNTFNKSGEEVIEAVKQFHNPKDIANLSA